MKRLIFILLFLAFCGINTGYYAQSGGKKREGGAIKAKRSFSLKRNRSAGHADKFARSTGRKGIFARLFHRERPAWVYRSSGSSKSNWKENRFLFSRHRSPGRQESDRYLEKQNARRERKRVKGNDSFRSRKYH